jgi:orotate phosphoribosyltransferase
MNMTVFQQADFNRFIIERGIVGFFDEPVTLKSGRISHWYINWRSAVEDAASLDKLSEFVLDFTDKLVREEKLDALPDTYFGVPEGATKLGVITQFKSARRSPDFKVGSHVVAMGRGKPKGHGLPRDRFFVGLPRGATVVLEDTTTTGGSLLETLDNLLEAGVDVTAAIGLSNRMERRDDGLSVAEAVALRRCRGKSVSYFHMSSAIELLPQVCRVQQVPTALREAVEAEFLSHGMEPLSLRNC